MEFKRQLYIEDLFVPKKIINAFDIVEFESIDIFKRCVNEDLYNIKENTMCVINIHSYEDFIFLSNLFKAKPEFFNLMNIVIIPNNEELSKKMLNTPIEKNMKFDILSKEVILFTKYWEKNKDWISANKLIMLHDISADSIAQDISRLITVFNTTRNRFFLLNIDYESFENITLKELQSVEFWWYQLRLWMREKIGKGQDLIIEERHLFVKRIFVSDDLTLYLDDNKDDIWNFPLQDHLQDTGNSINGRVLNTLHSYLSLHGKALVSDYDIKNFLLLSFRQFLRMGCYINQIPLIAGLIQRWLYG